MNELDLLEAVRLGPVLTVNRRLRAWLAEDYDRRMLLSGEKVWERPGILPVGVWLAEQLQKAAFDQRILNPVQHELVWHQVVGDDTRELGSPLVGLVSCARLALEAQKLLTDFCCDIDNDWGSEDVRAFMRWRRMWQTRAKREGWYGPHQIPQLVLQVFAESRLPVPKTVTLAGFDSIPPVLNRLFDSLASRGCRICRLSEPERTGEAAVVVADDPHDEVRRCAVWTRRTLTENPDARIGIVVPRLEDYRSLLLNQMEAELAPADCLDPSGEAPVNISLGTSLADEGAVYFALTLLGLDQDVDLNTIGLVLRSPFLAGCRSESCRRAGFDRELRMRAQKTDRWFRYSRLLQRAGLPHLKKIAAALDRWLHIRGRHLPGSWAERMANLLAAVGWPGEESLDRRTWQAVQHFLELLQTFASLDSLGVPLTRTEAVAHLARLARETEFQIDRTESRVQILGLLESSGLQFDFLWVMGLTDQVFPAPAAPNPFLPLPLQRQKGMPHADAEREFQFARNVWDRLRRAAPVILFSWPASIEGAECRPSPFLQGIPQGESPSTDNLVRPHVVIARHGALSSTVDAQGNPLRKGRLFSGGTAVLRDQALCPFRAYLHQRLRAECLEEAAIGIDARGRGNLVHFLVQNIWQALGGREKLRQMDPAALTNLLSRAADAALQSWQRREEIDLPERQCQLEKERLVRIGRTWLEVELERPDFEVIEMEKLQDVRIGDLLLKVRADRVDRLASGRQLIIDYKTGRPDIAHWFLDRLIEPQLPLYSLQIPEEDFAGAFFARIHCRRQDCTYLGVSRPEDAWDERRYRQQMTRMEQAGIDDWAGLLRRWKQALEQLAQEFSQGYAGVEPVDPEISCQNCDGKPVCRLLEKQVHVS